MKAKLTGVLLVTILLTSVGCAVERGPTPEAAELELRAEVNVDADNEVILKLGAYNASPLNFPRDKDFGGQWELTDESGTKRADGRLMLMGSLETGQTIFPIEWKSQLVPGAYTLTWSAANYDSIVVNFTITERDGELYIVDEEHFYKS